MWFMNDPCAHFLAYKSISSNVPRANCNIVKDRNNFQRLESYAYVQSCSLYGSCSNHGGRSGFTKKKQRSFTWRRGGIAQIFWKSGFVVCVWPLWAIHLTQKRIPTSIQKVGIKVGIKSGEFVIKFPPWSCHVSTVGHSFETDFQSWLNLNTSVFTQS